MREINGTATNTRQQLKAAFLFSATIKGWVGAVGFRAMELVVCCIAAILHKVIIISWVHPLARREDNIMPPYVT